MKRCAVFCISCGMVIYCVFIPYASEKSITFCTTPWGEKPSEHEYATNLERAVANYRRTNGIPWVFSWKLRKTGQNLKDVQKFLVLKIYSYSEIRGSNKI